jgi:alpha-tubulin suppressor-like RCC1 family protein
MNRRPLRTFSLLFGPFLLAACKAHDGPTVPSVRLEEAPGVTAGVAIATLHAKPGEVVNVSVRLDVPEGQAVMGLEGVLSLDPSRLRYVGQIPGPQSMAVVNEEEIQRGAFRFMALGLNGLGDRAAVFSFEVLEPGYADGLHLQVKRAGNFDGLVPIAGYGGIEVERNLGVAGVARRQLSAEHMARLLGMSPRGGPVRAPLPGNAEIGDCSLDGVIDVFDVLRVAQINVGLEPEPTEPLEFRVCDVTGDGSFDIFDVLDMASANAGNSPPGGSPVGAEFGPLDAGDAFTCGLATSGTLFCWGRNVVGVLGIGETGGLRDTPTAVVSGPEFLSFSGGASHACGLASDGAAYCWGQGQFGALGTGSTQGRTVPSPVAGGHTFQSISAGIAVHTCGLTHSGKALCWGGNTKGQLGNPLISVSSSLLPTEAAIDSGAVSLVVGGSHSCALMGDGSAYCWGSNSFGQLGNGTSNPFPNPAPSLVAGGVPFTSLALGSNHTCGLSATGAAWCWGQNTEGQIGDGTFQDRLVPVAVAGGHTFVSVSAGHVHTCGLTATGRAYCWGNNQYGQLGDLSSTERPTPVAVVGGLSFSKLALGRNHSCGLTLDGSTFCWGRNDGGELGNADIPNTSLQPVPTLPYGP